MAYSGFYLRACPKCGGDLARDQDWSGVYLTCLFCGFVYYPAQSLTAAQILAVGLTTALLSAQGQAAQR